MMKFSVLISTYYKDRPDFLEQALISIWDDQILKPDEIILVKDGELTEELEQVISIFSKSKPVNLVELTKNSGLGVALNKGLEACSNEYVARMDSDDISLPGRFKKQMEFLSTHPEVDIISGHIEEFNMDLTKRMGIRKLPLNNKRIVRFSKSRSPFNHMAVIFKKSRVLMAGGYPEITRFEDYPLWCSMLQKGFLGANLDEILVKVRINENYLRNRRGWQYFRKEVYTYKYLLKTGYLNYFQFISAIVPRILLRNIPYPLLSFIYFKLLRK